MAQEGLFLTVTWCSSSKHLTSARARAIYAESHNSMRVSAQGFWAPKLGNQDSEYEDAFYPRGQIIGQEAKLFSFAVADGATETSFSGIWGKQLVRAFCEGLLDGPDFSEQLYSLREHWHTIVS